MRKFILAKVYTNEVPNKLINVSLSLRHVQSLPLNIEDAIPISFVIDLFTEVLYWVDKNTHAIMFINLADPEKNGILFHNVRFHPRQLALFPERG